MLINLKFSIRTLFIVIYVQVTTSDELIKLDRFITNSLLKGTKKTLIKSLNLFKCMQFYVLARFRALLNRSTDLKEEENRCLLFASEYKL